MIAAIRVRGEVNLRHDIKTTMQMLHLHKKNFAIIIESNPTNMGMIEKVKDFITFGEISNENVEKVFAKRGEQSLDGIKIAGKTYKPFLRLAPPVKGFGKKGIKQPYSKGGALGNRGDKIIELMERML